MKEGDIILTPLPQANGTRSRQKIARRFSSARCRPFKIFSSAASVPNCTKWPSIFDEIIAWQDSDFSSSGLIAESLVRLGFLAVLPRKNIVGNIGMIAPERHARLLRTLSRYLEP